MQEFLKSDDKNRSICTFIGTLPEEALVWMGTSCPPPEIAIPFLNHAEDCDVCAKRIGAAEDAYRECHPELTPPPDKLEEARQRILRWLESK
jgi:hypothetical protein